MDANEGYWVFGYGSLMWDPGFEPDRTLPGRLHGWHRAMCIYSNHYRGTDEQPGLVLGLARGGSCRGIVFYVGPAKAARVRQYLHDREMITGVYDPRLAPVRLDDGAVVQAAIYVARRDHAQYAGGLDMTQSAELIRRGVGKAGRSRDYLANTVAQMDQLGLPKGRLHRLLRLVDQTSG